MTSKLIKKSNFEVKNVEISLNLLTTGDSNINYGLETIVIILWIRNLFFESTKRCPIALIRISIVSRNPEIMT